MPDKQKDSKIMSMLERRGIIRKADGESSDIPSDDISGKVESDIKPLFDHDETVMLKTAAKQPVPGMSAPILPSDNVPGVNREESKPSDGAAAVFSEPDDFEQDDLPAGDSHTSASSASDIQASAPRTSSLGNLNPFRNNGVSPDTAAMESVLRENERDVYSQMQPQPENYTDRYLGINELYDALALRSKKTESVYLIEEYLQTLPGSLPDSQRRDIVSKLLAASGFDFDLLMGDGVLRVKMLKEYAERFARHTDDYIAARQAELDELNQQIMRTNKLIENRKELHKKQFYTIEAEAQRLKEILTFISG